MRIGLLQTGHLPEAMQAEVGNYDELYSRLLKDEGIELITWPVVDGVFPPDLTAAEGWSWPWSPRPEQSGSATGGSSDLWCWVYWASFCWSALVGEIRLTSAAGSRTCSTRTQRS